MKRHYDNQNVIRINKTRICMALTVVIAMFCFIGHAEAQDCYNTNRSNGITAMRNKDYDKAIRWFEVAKKCPDKPENNDLQSKIDECKDLKRQTSQVSEEKKKLDEEKRKLEEEKRKLEEEKKKLEKERKEEAKKKPEETKSSSTKNDSASGTANNNNNMLAQISDDFDGNSINSQYWTAIGNVKVSNGMVTISQSQTDKDMSLTTKDLAVPKSKKIVIERRFLNHKAKNYYYGGFSINLNGNPNEFVGINYFYGDYEKWYGTKITYKLDGKEKRIDLRSTEFDTWITDKVIIDFAAGTMTYYLDNNLIATKTVPNFSSKNVSYYNVRFHSYGWWTGHYSNIDYVRIGDLNGMPSAPKTESVKNEPVTTDKLFTRISDDFNGNSINSQYWTAIGDVKVSNGMVTISQSQTDKDMSMKTKDLQVPASKKIAIERRFRNHKANNQYHGGFGLFLNGNDNEVVGINYYSADYERWYGTKASYKLNGKEGRIDLCSAQYDTWLTEKVIIDFGAGALSYYLDNNFIKTVTIPGLSSKNVTHYSIRYASYGWWTGHYSNMDYIRISDVEGEPNTTRQSNEYVPTVDTRYWDLIYSQNANEKKYCDGVYGNNVECFSTYVKINRNKFRISFDFEAMESTKPEGQYVMVLSGGWRVFAIYLTKDGDIKVTTNNQRNTYLTGLKYNMGESTIIEAEFDNGTLIINGVKIQNVDINRTDGDNKLSSINYSNGTAFHGYIKNVKVYNGK